MKFKERSFPHPVMRPGSDDVLPIEYGVNFGVEIRDNKYILRTEHMLGNEDLRRLIVAGDASFTQHIECLNTFYRTSKSTQATVDVIEVDADAIVGTLEASFFVIASRSINNYAIRGAHADYAGTLFQIRPGDVLAVANSQTFEAEKDYDSLKKISSIMNVLPSEQDDCPQHLSFDEDKIGIHLRKDLYDKYAGIRDLAKNHPSILQAIVIPVLVEAIASLRNQIQTESEDGAQYRWQRVICQKFADLQIDIRTTNDRNNKLAQALLNSGAGAPVSRYLQSLYGGDE